MRYLPLLMLATVMPVAAELRVENLEANHPGIKARLVDGGALRSNLAVAVDGEVSVLGMLEDVPEGAEVHFIPAISGGLRCGLKLCGEPRPPGNKPPLSPLSLPSAPER